MASLQVSKVTFTGTTVTNRKLQVSKVTFAGTSISNRKLQVSKVTFAGSGQVRVHSITDTPAVEPGTPVTATAVIASAPPGTVTWAWTQVSGPTVLPIPNGDTVTFVAPSVMPGDDGTIVLGVTATVGGVISAQVTATSTVLPQTRWAWDGTRWVGAALTTPLGGPSTGGAGNAVDAVSSDSLLNRFGVQVHMSSDFPAYSSVSQVQTLLTGLGVRLVRDTYNVGFPTQHAHQAALGAAGFKFCMTARLSDTPSATVNGVVSDGLVPYIKYMEGINEPDNAGGSWAANTRTHQQAYYPLVKAAAGMSAMPVLAPALANTIANAPALGDLSAYCDRANAHVYSGNPPTGTGSFTLANTIAQARTVSGAGKPAIITEQGYHNLLASTSSIRPVDETTGGIYAPRIALENWLLGTEAVFNYELLDQGTSTTDAQNHYGLVRNDGTPKPAYTALATLLALLSDPGSAFTPAPLQLTVTPPAGNTDVRWLLTGKRDGSYVLLLWRDVSVWNPSTQTAISVATVPVTVAHPSGSSTVSLGAAWQSVTIPAGG